MKIPILYRYRIIFFFFACTTLIGFVLANNNFELFFSSELFALRIGVVPVGFLLYVCIPVIIISFLCVLLFRLYSDSQVVFKKNKIQRRVFLTLLITGFLITLPFSSVTIGFFRTFAQSNENQNKIHLIESAIDIANMYYDEKVALIERISQKQMTALTIQTYKSRPEDLWTLLLREDSAVLCFQVFSPTGEPYIEAGDSAYFLLQQPNTEFYNGILTRNTIDEPDIIRAVTTAHIGDDLYTCVFTSSFPKGFDVAYEELLFAYDAEYKQSVLRKNAALLGFPLFLLCLIPALSLYIVLLYRIALDIAEKNNHLVKIIYSGSPAAEFFLTPVLQEECALIQEKLPNRNIDIKDILQSEPHTDRIVYTEVQVKAICKLLFSILIKSSSPKDTVAVSMHYITKKLSIGIIPYYRVHMGVDSIKWNMNEQLIETHITKIEHIIQKNTGSFTYYQKKTLGGHFFIDFPAITV